MNPDYKPRIGEKRKVPACKSKAFYTEWNKQHSQCMVCGIRSRLAGWIRWPGLSTHHIVKPGRAHEATNLIRMCHRCHNLAEGQRYSGHINGKPFVWERITIPMVLWCKIRSEPEVVNLDRLNELQGCYLEAPTPVYSELLWEWNDRLLTKDQTGLAWSHTNLPHDKIVRPCYLKGKL